MSTTPLLSNIAGEIDEETAQLATQKKQKRWWAVLAFSSMMLLVVFVVVPAVYINKSSTSKSPRTQKNVILMVSDGMGPSSLSLARSFVKVRNHLDSDEQLFLDQYLLGTSRTRSSNSFITDSAAGATAFSCGIHTYNNAVAVDDNQRPCGTILEAAKRKGMMTGIVVTSSVTDATPASFSAHVRSRWQENMIAEQHIGRTPLSRILDLMFGGGLCRFLPKTVHTSCRLDGKDLLGAARETGYQVVTDRRAFDHLAEGRNVSLPVLGLFGEGHMAFEIDRIPSLQPSLAEMTLTALNALEQQSEKGFFLMVEGSRIDHASHSNDPVGHANEIMAYNEAFRTVKEWIDKHDGLVISTSDHETGGVATAIQLSEDYPEYVWYPEVLAQAKHSAEYLSRELAAYHGSNVTDFIKNELVGVGLAISDPTNEELERVKRAKGNQIAGEYALAKMVSDRAGIGYTTHGHSAADVLLFGYGKGTEELRGNHENIDIGRFITRYLDLDLASVTRELNSGDTSWYRGRS